MNPPCPCCVENGQLVNLDRGRMTIRELDSYDRHCPDCLTVHHRPSPEHAGPTYHYDPGSRYFEELQQRIKEIENDG